MPLHHPRSARFSWVSDEVAEYMRGHLYSVLESHILDSNRRASEGFPAPPILPAIFHDHGLEGDWDALEDDWDTLEGDSDKPDPLDTTVKTLPVHPDADHKTYDALVIDCEMVRIKGGQQSLLSIAVVDFFTGRIVLRSLVRPTGIVTDWRREVTGFNKARMKEAIKKGKVLANWAVVRQKIFDVTNPKTIFIGHALANDLRVLHIAADRVVDSMTTLSRTVFGDAKTFPRTWGLKSACEELLNLAVQKTRGPHDPLEDAFATRELVLKFVEDPEKLTKWGEKTRANMAQIVQKEREKEEARRQKKELRKAERAKKSPEQLLQEAAEKARKKEEARKAEVAKKEALAKQKKLMKARKKQIKKWWERYGEVKKRRESTGFKMWSEFRDQHTSTQAPE
ncbi:hypothetical protein RRF57_009982 [Xylaria bambusicola]|uniref:Exonuclease domain-containing protein n=1 Tax=Xylaria bambusicola TaxID=326684 RepID=A0AAN7ZCD9_9PEZI